MPERTIVGNRSNPTPRNAAAPWRIASNTGPGPTHSGAWEGSVATAAQMGTGASPSCRYSPARTVTDRWTDPSPPATRRPVAVEGGGTLNGGAPPVRAGSVGTPLGVGILDSGLATTATVARSTPGLLPPRA